MKNLKDKKIMLLCPDRNDYWAKETAKQSNNVHVFTLFKKCNKLLRLARKIVVKLNLPIVFFLDSWYHKIHHYDLIIIDANFINSNLPQWIRKKNYTGKIVYWYWNPVISCVHPDKIDKSACELWSFDPSDCLTYNMKFNSTYYFSTFKFAKDNDDIDIFFVGREKGRLSYLNMLENKFLTMGLKPYFHIVSDNSLIKTPSSKPLISYDKVLSYISNSKAILDIVQDGQTGQTLRTMEAMFFSKKLITNNISITECDFYRKENIFILGQDNINDICEFLNGPFLPLPKYIREKYEFINWIDRFFDK